LLPARARVVVKRLSERGSDGECDDERETQKDLVPRRPPLGSAAVGQLARAAGTFRAHGS
jgi:hypothetical protein